MNLKEEIKKYAKKTYSFPPISFNIFPPAPKNDLYSRKDLTGQEKDSIAIGSCWYTVMGDNLFKKYKK